jgi:hypothetical protein
MSFWNLNFFLIKDFTPQDPHNKEDPSYPSESKGK